jgi:hypothetical protein
VKEQKPNRKIESIHIVPRMTFLSKRHGGVVAWLVLATITASATAFVPSKAFVPSAPVALSQEKALGDRTSKTLTASPPTTTLRMGVMEDFITGTDEKTRKRENDEYLAKLQKRVDKINALEPEIEDLGDEELQAKTKEFKERLAKGEDINGPILEEAFAVVREAAW